MGQAPKPTKLFDIEHWYQAPMPFFEKGKKNTNPKRLIATLQRGVPYALARFNKRVQEGMSHYPKGTFFKIVKHPETTNPKRDEINSTQIQS